MALKRAELCFQSEVAGKGKQGDPVLETLEHVNAGDKTTHGD